MDTATPLKTLAALRAISPDYIDFKGQPAVVPIDRQAGILRTMGYPVDGDALKQALFTVQSRAGKHGIPATIVLRPDGFLGFTCKADPAASGKPLSWSLQLESGIQLSGDTVFGEPICHSKDETDLPVWADFQIKLVDKIPLGYHHLTVSWYEGTYEAVLIQTPERGYIPESLQHGEKIWGPSIQLYTLRSARNWGMGDFSDLCTLIDSAAQQGAGFVGLNPIHALFVASPEHASPYSPCNRSMLNVLYIDPESVSEFRLSEACQSWFHSTATQTALSHARATQQVNYSEVHRLKWHAFDLMYQGFRITHLALGTARAKKFLAFVELGGEQLQAHCLFDALLQHFHQTGGKASSWEKWPQAYHSRQSAEVLAFESSHQEAVQKHQYLQFVAMEQLEAASIKSQEMGMPLGIYRDLAVGADRGGSEVWQDPDAFCIEASVGAPPDALGPVGQNWGLPPQDPWYMQATHYSQYVRLIKSNMRACGALRIDHAMALARLWWCPPGETAAEGCYVAYPLEDLLGILLLESHRQQCLVIAEDLGTVPENVRAAFPRAQLFSNKVFYFEIGEQGCTAPEDYPQHALAIVANHDMPTLTAYWSASDLELRQTLGMFADDGVFQQERQGRDIAKSAIISALRQDPQVSEADWLAMGGEKGIEDRPMSLALSTAIHRNLASAPTQLVAVQLEDMLLIESPVNVPGTSVEYANWCRKMTLDTAPLFKSPEIQQFCAALNQARN